MKDRDVVRRIWLYARRYKWAFVLSYAVLLVELVCNQMVPLFLRRVVNYAVYDTDVRLFLHAALRYALVFLAYASCGFVQLVLWQRLHNQYIYDLRVRCYQKVLRMQPRVLSDIRTGDVIHTIQVDTQEFHHIIQRYAMRIVNAGLGTVISLVIVARMQWQIALFMLLVIPLSTVLSRRIEGKMKRASVEMRDAQGQYGAWLLEILKGMRDIKLFVAEKTVLRRFMEQNHGIVRKAAKQDRLQFKADQLIHGIYFLADLVFYSISALFVVHGSIDIGEYVAIAVYFGMVSYYVKRVLRGNVDYQRRKTCVERVLRLLDEPEEENGQLAPLRLQEGSIDIRDLSFSYDPQKEVLRHLCFQIRPGEKIGVAGASGVGKSTLAGLLLRFYPPSQGTICIDGQDLQTCQYTSVRQAVGIVNQENIIFPMTVRDNITFGVSATDAQLWTLLEAVSLRDVIAELPQGLDTILGPGQRTLSGGQNQRLCIARMLFRNPGILILDEATSALDPKSEAEVQAALDVLSRGRTTIVISHRRSTLLHTDKILVLHEGEQVGFDSYSRLMEENAYFTAMFAEEKEETA